MRTASSSHRTVFISYCNESEDHAKAVRVLAERLQNAGMPVELDQMMQEECREAPERGWPHWCEERAANAECVLVVASSGWLKAYDEPQDGNSGTGLGAATEARVIRSTLEGGDPKLNSQPWNNARVRLVFLETSGTLESNILSKWQRFEVTGRRDDLDRMVSWIKHRLSIPRTIPAPEDKREQKIYLAECKDPDHSLREKLQAALFRDGWTVLPAQALANAGSDADFEASVIPRLEESAAFVQILEKDSWAGSPRDHLQFQWAVRLGLPCYRYRPQDLKLQSVVNATHREFLSALPLSLNVSFRDFKDDLFNALNHIWLRLCHPPIRRTEKLVRIVHHSRRPDAHKRKFEAWFRQCADVQYDRLKSYDPKSNPLASLQKVSPCDGFLLMCDESTFSDSLYMPGQALKECRTIQIEIFKQHGGKDLGHCPPLGIVYWAPPNCNDKTFSTLLDKFETEKLFTLVGDQYQDGGPVEFLQAVREVAA